MKSPFASARSAALCLAFAPCLALACHAEAAAQRRRAAAPARGTPAAAVTRPAPRPAWLISEQPYNEDGRLTTLVSLQPMPLGARGLSFGVGFSYEGRSPANFRNVSLSIFSNAEQCRFPADAALALTLDGQPSTLPYRPDAKGADGVWWVAGETEGGPCTETLVAYVSPVTLARLAAARTLAGNVGQTSFQFTPANLAALRDFVSRLRMPQLSPATPLRPRPRPRRP